MSRRDFFEFNTPVETKNTSQTQEVKIPRGMGKAKTIEPNSETAHELNRMDLEYAVKALEEILEETSDPNANSIAADALEKVSQGDYFEGERFPYLVRHMMKHKQPVKKDNFVWAKPIVTLESNTYSCKYNGSESIHQLYYNNFTGKWSTIGTPTEPEITVTAPDLIQIN
jgi:hypothetical protein